MKKYRLLSGFTLIELMVTVAIAAILITAAGPSFTDLVSGAKADSAVRRLANSFAYARSEAVTRGADIRVCATADGITCSAIPADWTLGWLVVDGAGGILKVEDISSSQVDIGVDAGFSSVCFNNLGEECIGGVALATFTATSNGQFSRMTLNRTGAVRIVCINNEGAVCD
jgi:type IV fimbrial biogenesis protein FimT